MRHSSHTEPGRERERESVKERRRTGRGVKGGKEERGSEEPAGSLGLFSGGQWDQSQGGSKVGEFLIRKGRCSDGGKMLWKVTPYSKWNQWERVK